VVLEYRRDNLECGGKTWMRLHCRTMKPNIRCMRFTSVLTSVLLFFCFYLLCDKRCESISKFYVMDNMDEGKSFVLHSIYKRQPLKQ